MTKITCPCGHTWDYKGESKARYILCPVCRKNLPNPNFKNPKDE